MGKKKMAKKAKKLAKKAKGTPRPAFVDMRFALARPLTPTQMHSLVKISDTDRAIVESMNRRLELVARLKRYKESRGLDFVDVQREEWMLSYLSRANRGPLTDEGLRELFAEVLDLTKREVARREEA